MPELYWTLATLTPEQEKEIKEAEAALGEGVALLAFQRGIVSSSQLTEEQIDILDRLERKLGLAILAVNAKYVAPRPR